MIDVPAFFAVIVPFFVTVTTFFLLEDHVVFLIFLMFFFVILRVCFSPVSKVIFFLFNFNTGFEAALELVPNVENTNAPVKA